MQQIYKGTPMPKSDFNKVAKQEEEHFWRAASEFYIII